MSQRRTSVVVVVLVAIATAALIKLSPPTADGARGNSMGTSRDRTIQSG